MFLEGLFAYEREGGKERGMRGRVIRGFLGVVREDREGERVKRGARGEKEDGDEGREGIGSIRIGMIDD